MAISKVSRTDKLMGIGGIVIGALILIGWFILSARSLAGKIPPLHAWDAIGFCGFAGLFLIGGTYLLLNEKTG